MYGSWFSSSKFLSTLVIRREQNGEATMAALEVKKMEEKIKQKAENLAFNALNYPLFP